MVDMITSYLYYQTGCCSEDIRKSKFNSMIGLVDRERVDEELYDDYESSKAREVRMPSCAYYLDV